MRATVVIYRMLPDTYSLHLFLWDAARTCVYVHIISVNVRVLLLYRRYTQVLEFQVRLIFLWFFCCCKEYLVLLSTKHVNSASNFGLNFSTPEFQVNISFKLTCVTNGLACKVSTVAFVVRDTTVQKHINTMDLLFSTKEWHLSKEFVHCISFFSFKTHFVTTKLLQQPIAEMFSYILSITWDTTLCNFFMRSFT